MASVAGGQEQSVIHFSDDEMTAKYRTFSPQQLFDSGYYHLQQNNTDEAMICFSLLINAPQNTDVEFQKMMIKTYVYSAAVFFHVDNFRIAYELLLKALQLSDAVNDITYKHRIYTLMGNIYHRFGKQDLAKQYFSNALILGQDSTLILNNLGYASIINGDLEDAFQFLSRAIRGARQENSEISHIVLHSLSTYYLTTGDYDSAFYYYRQTLEEAKKGNSMQREKSISLAYYGLGKLFFESNQPDSAIYYITLSNTVASKNDFLGILMDNYLLLSQIEEHKGNKIQSYEYFRQHSSIKDSIFSREKIVEVNQLQLLHDANISNREIEHLRIDQAVKNKTIRFQKTIYRITLAVLLLITTMLAFMFVWYKKLNTAYRKLFEKDLEIIELQENLPETSKKHKNYLTDEKQKELLSRIYEFLDDVSVVCDPDLSIEKFAKLLHSNRMYVSEVINDALKKNFRELINDYRVREAQRLFAEADATKYTIESVSLKVGFKSRNTFNIVFKEITGVSPSFYFKSMRNR
jgi:AraC-like DNA-binding protein/Tfp pilus assembly protein PilF